MGNQLLPDFHGNGSGVSVSCSSCYTCHEKKKRTTSTLKLNKSSHGDVCAVQTSLSSECAAVLAAFEDGTVNVFISKTGGPFSCYSSSTDGDVSCLSVHQESFRSLSTEADGILKFGIGTKQGNIGLWELDTKCGVLLPGYRWHGHEALPGFGSTFNGVSSLAYEGEQVVSGGANSTVSIWSEDRQCKKAGRHLDGAHGGAVTAACYGTVAKVRDFSLTGGEDGILKAWSLSGDCVLPSHERDRDCHAPNVRSSASTTGGVCSLVLDGKYFRCCGGFEDGFVRLWDLSAARGTLRLGHFTQACNAKTAFSKNHVECVAFDSMQDNFSKLATGSDNGSICVWDIRTSPGRGPCMTSNFFSKQCTSLALHGHIMVAASKTGSAHVFDLRGMNFVSLQSVDLSGAKSGEVTQFEETLAPSEATTTYVAADELDDVSSLGDIPITQKALMVELDGRPPSKIPVGGAKMSLDITRQPS